MKLAQVIKLPGGQEVKGPLDPTRFPNLPSLVTNALPYVFGMAGIILFIYIVWGGFDFMTSMGDPKKAESGKNKITYAILGFVIIFVAYWIVQLVIYIFNLKTTL
jgi:hypothetical protein